MLSEDFEMWYLIHDASERINNHIYSGKNKIFGHLHLYNQTTHQM